MPAQQRARCHNPVQPQGPPARAWLAAYCSRSSRALLLKVIQGVRYTDLEENHVRTNMGPIVIRGLWYPFVRVGV